MRVSKGLQSLMHFYSSIHKKSYYEVLQLSPLASCEEIKQNYYRLAKEYHPDKNPQFSAEFKQISEAYNTLRDPTQKQRYDQQSLIFTTFSTNMQGSQPNRASHTAQQNGYDSSNQRPSSTAYSDRQRDYQNTQNMQKSESQYDRFMWQTTGKAQRQRRMEKERTRKRNKLKDTFRIAMIVGLGVLSVVIVAEIILGVYHFQANQRQKSFQRQRPEY